MTALFPPLPAAEQGGNGSTPLESVRWLAAKGRFGEARAVVAKQPGCRAEEPSGNLLQRLIEL